jgi:hypothetical protein
MIAEGCAEVILPCFLPAKPGKNGLPYALYDLQMWDHLSLSECAEIALLPIVYLSSGH